MMTDTAMTTPVIVEISGGVADISQGEALVVDWDDLEEDASSAREILESLVGQDSPAANRIRERLLRRWPAALEEP